MTPSPLAEHNTASGLIQLEAALCHLLSVVESWTSLGELVVKTIEAFIVDAIRRGLVSNYAALSSFAADGDFAEVRPRDCVDPQSADLGTQSLPVDLPEANRIQQHFLEAWALWEPTYALQEHYHILERYLGLKGPTRIVPDVIQPRTYSDMLKTDAP